MQWPLLKIPQLVRDIAPSSPPVYSCGRANELGMSVLGTPSTYTQSWCFGTNADSLHLRVLVLGCVLRDAGFGQEVPAEEAPSLRPLGAVT